MVIYANLKASIVYLLIWVTNIINKILRIIIIEWTLEEILALMRKITRF